MKITVIGAGNSGLAMSAHLSYYGHQVSLWNRSERTIKRLLDTNIIHVSGIINEPVKINKVTTDIVEALDKTELVLITTPASAHGDLGELLGSNMTSTVPIILNPGRTFGAINFYRSFKKNNRIVEPIVAETQTIVYTCRKDSPDHVTIYSIKREVEIASLEKHQIDSITSCLPSCIRDHYKSVDCFLQTSLGNVGLVLHCIPLMLNTGWTECDKSEYKYYYEGITPTIARFIQHIDDERIKVGKALGIDIESTMDWMKREYLTFGSNLYECIQNNKAYNEIDAPKSINHRYIFEDVPTGLVPVEIMGRELNVETRHISIAIDLANALLEQDFRANSEWISYERIKEFL